METVHSALKFIYDNQIYIYTLVSIVAAVKAALWGASKAQALNMMVDAVQKLDATPVKEEVRKDMETASKAVQDAIQTSVMVANPALPDPIWWKVILREVLRGVYSVKQVH